MKFMNYDVTPFHTKYCNGNLAVGISYEDDDYDVLTVNLPESDTLRPGEAYVDTNNCPQAYDFFIENGIGEPTSDYAASGFCMYPLFKFNLEKCKEL